MKTNTICNPGEALHVQTESGDVEIVILRGRRGRFRAIIRGPDGLKIKTGNSTDIDCQSENPHNVD